jgi:5-methylcytosine-specific restriction enzyme A
MKLKTLKPSPLTTVKHRVAQPMQSPSRTGSKWSNTRRALNGTTRANKRKEVWAEQKGLCSSCCGVFKPVEMELDHIIPLHLNGTDDRSNLQMLCIECHKIKTREELGARK